MRCQQDIKFTWCLFPEHGSQILQLFGLFHTLLSDSTKSEQTTQPDITQCPTKNYNGDRVFTRAKAAIIATTNSPSFSTKVKHAKSYTSILPVPQMACYRVTTKWHVTGWPPKHSTQMFKFPFNTVRVTLKLQHMRYSQWNNITTGNTDNSTSN